MPSEQNTSRYKREQLGNSPLIEAIFELQVTCAQSYSLVAGALFTQLRERFPTVEHLPTAMFSNIPGMPPIPGLPRMAHHRFCSADGKRLVQTGPEVFTSNIVRDYGSFTEFDEQTRRALRTFADVAQPIDVHRMGLRYINLVKDSILVDLDEPFHIDVRHPAGIGAPSERHVRIVVPTEEPKGHLAIAVAHPGVTSDGQKGSLLDIDFFTQQSSKFDIESCARWVAAAHNVVYQAFRSTLSDGLYEKLR